MKRLLAVVIILMVVCGLLVVHDVCSGVLM